MSTDEGDGILDNGDAGDEHEGGIELPTTQADENEGGIELPTTQAPVTQHDHEGEEKRNDWDCQVKFVHRPKYSSNFSLPPRAQGSWREEVRR